MGKHKSDKKEVKKDKKSKHRKDKKNKKDKSSSKSTTKSRTEEIQATRSEKTGIQSFLTRDDFYSKNEHFRTWCALVRKRSILNNRLNTLKFTIALQAV
jgi:hypothetical protein